MAFFIDGPEARIIRTGDTSVELRIFAGEVYTDLEPRRLFPMSGLKKYITLLDSELNEKAIIRDIERLDEQSRIAIEDCLNEYYMVPKILSMIDVTEKFGVITWTCVTDRGTRQFRIKNRHSDVKLLFDGRVLVRDSNDNRYEIEDISSIPTKEISSGMP